MWRRQCGRRPSVGGYDKGLVALSILIAVVAATAALWFSLVLESPVSRFAAGLVMGIAVTGMHYRAWLFSFLFPVLVIALLALVIPITAVMLAPDRGALRAEPRAVPEASPAA